MTDRAPIDFPKLAAALLDQAHSLVPRWLPAGVERNGRWYVGDFDGSPGESANVSLQTGTWIDNAAPDEDKGGDLISLYARVRGLNNGQAARELMRDMGWDRTGVAPVQTPARRAPVSAGAEPQDGDMPPWLDEPLPGTPAAPGVKRRSMWRAVVPVPPRAPAPVFEWGYRDKKTDTYVRLQAVRTWEYSFEGTRYGYVARFERFNSAGDVVKDTLPLTWCVDESDGRGTMRWHWKQWEAPRPLYVPATLLSADLSLPVVIVEGEKCAEAGHRLLGHEFDFVSWPGGAKAWPLASWAWLMGRTVYLWPDCDAQRKRLSREEREQGTDPKTKPLLPEPLQPGNAAMAGIGTLLVQHQACTVFRVKIPKPGAVREGWDIADAIDDGWSADQVRDFIRAAAPFVPPDDSVRAAAGNSARSMAPADGGEEAPEDAGEAPWRKHLILSSTGSIKPVRENVVLALDGWPERKVPGVPEAKDLIAFNEFTNNVDKLRDTPWGTSAGSWEECDELLMGQWLVREHGLPSMPREQLEQAVLMVAHLHAYHPVRAQVEACRGTWDGTPRLETWLRRCCLEEDEWDDDDPRPDVRDLYRYLALTGKWFVMAMCCRVLPQEKHGAEIVRGPGTKFDYMLILEGPQGYGKSTMAKVLGGDYFADTGLALGEKDSFQNIQGVRVYEWGELDSMSRQEVTKVKSFISSPKDRFRASFDRRPRDYPRQVVFVGTTNESHYLTDTTGNRRFWPVRVTRAPDSAWLAENLDQLYAEALMCLDRRDRFWPTREEQASLFDPQQRTRSVESAIESAIRHYLFDEDQKVPHQGVNGAFVSEIGMGDLLTRIGFSIDKQTDAVIKKAGAVMHMLGWDTRRTSLPGRPRVYVRPKASNGPSVQRSAAAGGSTGSTGPTQGQTAEDPDAIPF
jgi:putative DNA primase/helicase